MVHYLSLPISMVSIKDYTIFQKIKRASEHALEEASHYYCYIYQSRYQLCYIFVFQCRESFFPNNIQNKNKKQTSSRIKITNWNQSEFS